MGLSRRASWDGKSHVDRVPVRDAAQAAPEKQRAHESVTRTDDPIPVRVWVTQRQTGEFEADGEALAWTSKQAFVRYFDPFGREGHSWLWAAAVTRR